MNKVWNYRIDFLSDWKIGTGAGKPGGTDELVRRDQYGLPFVPSKSIFGIWRDAAEQLTASVQEMNPRMTDWLTFLFGSQPNVDAPPQNKPTPAALTIGSAHLSGNLRDAILNSSQAEWVKQELGFQKAGIKISPLTGQTIPNFLRFEEMARGGMSLNGIMGSTVDLELEGQQERFLQAFLSTSANLIERMGGGRRRGAGRAKVTIELNDVDAKLLLDGSIHPPDLAASKVAAFVPPEIQTTADQASSQRASAATELEELPLRIKLQTSLLVASATVGNVVLSHDFVPGAYLLGYVCRRLKRLGVAAHQWLQQGRIKILNGHREINGRRSQPVPFCLAMEKGYGWSSAASGKVINTLMTAPGERQFKQCRHGWLGCTTGSDGGIQLVWDEVTRSITTHNVINDKAQTPLSADAGGEGGVYSYESIDHRAGDQAVVFQSVLVLARSCVDELNQVDSAWPQKLVGRISLGRSKKDEYGSALIEVGKLGDVQRPSSIADDQFFVQFVSDCLIDSRQRFQPTSDALLGEMSKALGVPEAELKIRCDEKLASESIRVRRHESWQTSWGLPRPSLIGIQAGSCFVVQSNKPIDIEKLASMQARGLGRRTVEGFGEIRINDPVLTSDSFSQIGAVDRSKADSEVSNNVSPISQSSSDFSTARSIETSLWNQRIRQTALSIAFDPDKRKEIVDWQVGQDSVRPPMSQLGNLRNSLAHSAASDFAGTLEWLAHLKATKNRVQKWPKGAESIEKLEALLHTSGLEKSRHPIWRHYDTGKWPVLTVDGGAALRKELWSVAVRALLFAIIQAVKRESEPKRSVDDRVAKAR